MPLVTLHLLALSPDKTIPQYLRALHSASIKPLVTSKVIRWIIKPEKLSTHLLNQTWHLLLILPAATATASTSTSTTLPSSLLTPDWIHRHWSITAGIPSSLTTNFPAKNHRLLHPQKPDEIPPLTGSLRAPLLSPSNSPQNLELTPDLLEWSTTSPLARAHTPVSMLNLLSFHRDPAAHASYLHYGRAFSESIGSKRGGLAKLVGKVVPDHEKSSSSDQDKYGWDEMALAHYPSTQHFADMLGSEDYQKVNREFRVVSLRDTCILCTSEVDAELEVWGEEAGKARL